jgi:hypothetical protein
MNDDLRISISSPLDREFLVAEIFINNEQWVELNQEEGVLLLEIYPRRDKQPWRIRYATAIEALTQAKERLVGKS